MFFYPKRIQFTFPRIKIAEHEIFIPQTLDSLNIPIQGGLQDTMLGPQPHETQCAKCHLNYFTCPGHFGEIVLQSMILNPLLFKDLFTILRMSCLKCHRFKIPVDVRKHVLQNTGERLVAAMKERVEGRCPYCASRDRLKKLNLKIVNGTQYVQPFRVYRIVCALRKNEPALFERIHIDYKAFFMHKVFVLPNKFRPLNRMNDKIFESSHNIHLSRIVKINRVLKDEIEKLWIKDEESKRSKGNESEKSGMDREIGVDETDRVSGADKTNRRGRESKTSEERKRAEKDENRKSEMSREQRINKDLCSNIISKNNRRACLSTANIDQANRSDKEAVEKGLGIEKDNRVNTHIDDDLLNMLSCADEKSVALINGLINALQCAVQHYFDSTEYPNKKKPPGFKQTLEKKEGLFRQNMMGKRVNYTARTVISPDPYIATDEIGIPMHIARRLTFPERVTPFNRQRLERCVINGPIFPGAECIVENGVKRSLKYVKNRGALAKTLLKNSAVVHRHMTYGDMVLVNRQPTLHKPSLMSHRVCILNDKTIRMHYVNCNSYNADFDGDEMNIHLAQSLVARAENAYLSSTHENYALNGKPVRGLVQDYVVSVFNITLKDRLFSRSEINELLIASRELRFTITSPAVLRPKALYTGKQLVAILLSAYDLKMNYLHTNKISTLYWKEHYEESTVRFHNGYYVHGVLDKSEVGPSKDGLVHCIGMLKGFHVCNDILTAIGRMVSRYLVCYGQPLGISDFVLEKKHERIRADIFKEGMERGDGVLQGYVQEVFKDVGGGRDGNTKKENTKNVNYGIDIDNDTNTTIDPVGVINHVTVPSSSTLYNTPVTMAPMINLSKNERINLDNVIKKEMHTVTSQVGDLLIKGIETPFPLNKMANIILSGAKGSIVNFSQISGLLGQQSLEGGRVPLMSNGRSLCSFLSSNVLSGGFIFNRFLTGLSLSSFFFHCQAGREGLIDTAVKTSRSGYLQRCIVKMMEGTVVHYDTSVRDDLLVQYVYGEDGKDPNRILNERFIEMNTVKDQSDDKNVENKDWADGENITKDESNEKKCKNIDKSNTAICSTETEDKPPLKGTDMQISSAFLRQRIQPGESVGMIAAQAIGEPSTQMTLNTFHLAGCATNVTLGMPRLKEILMVGSKNVSTVIKGKITNRITFDPSTVFLKDALFYFKVVERNETDVLFVLNRDVGKDTIVRFKRMFLKEINKGMGKRVTVREIIRNNKRDVGDGLDSDNSSEDCLDSSSNGAGLSTGIDSNRGRNISISNDENDAVVENNSNETAGNTINDGNGAIFSRIYTEKELIEQIRDHSWSYNVIRVTLSACVPVNSTIEKMREKFRLLDSDITGIEINNDEVTVLGCDYHTFFNYVPSHSVYLNDYIDFNTCISNDVYNTWEVLGIEACRSVIIREIRAVFQAYGIEIDVRHLMLIADKMTVTGEYVAFNRHRMGGSVLGKMSFESTYNFLRKAYLYGCDDELEEPSARVALGLPVRNGTGMFDLLYDDK